MRSLSPFHKKTMAEIVASSLGPVSQGSASYTQPSTLSPKESARNWSIRLFLSKIIFRRNLTRNTVNLYGDVIDKHGNNLSQQVRQAEWFRQASMPWQQTYMIDTRGGQNLNNPQQASFVKQPQRTTNDKTYGMGYQALQLLNVVSQALSQMAEKNQ